MSDWKFKLEAEVKDSFSGFKGIVIGQSTFLTGCDRYLVDPCKLNSDGEPADALWFDEARLTGLPSIKPGGGPNPPVNRFKTI